MKFNKSFVILTYLTIFSLLLNIANSYNIDEKFPIIKQGAEGSLFGLAVAQHHIKAKVSSLNEVTLLVGAPKAKATASSIVTGGLFKCPISSQTDDCKLVKVEEKIEDNQNNQWLGVTVESEKPGGRIGVCAHRRISENLIDTLFGRCFILRSNLTLSDNPAINPCGNSAELTVTHAYYRYCQAGTSFAFKKGENANTCYFGLPGAYHWTGTVGIEDIIDDAFLDSGKLQPIGYKELKSHDIVRNSYLGFSIVTGNLSINKSIYAVGAPRLNDTGAVVIFETKDKTMNFENLLLGELVASAFGYAGDSLSPLLTSEPP